MAKRGSLDSFFQPKPKAPRLADGDDSGVAASGLRRSEQPASEHLTYPFPIPQLPADIKESFDFLPACGEPRAINDQPDLDLLYFSPFIPKETHRQLFKFLRNELPFYRVKYTIKRGPVETQINTPRWTTVFGLDNTSIFSPDRSAVWDAVTEKPVPKNAYKCTPRPIPECLDVLRRATEVVTGETFNFCLVNYYATGSDSISYHSDDEKFLGTDPAIASFSLGAKRDFLMKHKPPKDPPASKDADATKPLKLPLASGDMILMRGRTQSNWLHSIPKRKGGEADSGRINITLRKAVVKYGTENYNQYNVGTGPPYKWDEARGEMVEWKP